MTTLEIDRAPEDVRDKIKQLMDLVDAAGRLWPAYEVYVSAGATSAAFHRHVWPVIRDVRAILSREPDVPPRDVRYAVGYRDAPGSYGMAYGPLPTYEECLEFLPTDYSRPAFVIKFDPDEGDHPVARWDARRCRWRPL